VARVVTVGGRRIDVDAQLLALDAADCEDSLYVFLRSAWRYIDPSEWCDGWPIEVIAEHLEAAIDGEIKRLIINLPPRMGKSSIAGVALPAWTWAQPEERWSPTCGPGTPFLHASYAESLSLRDSVKCRRLIESPWYQARWGHRFQLNSDQNTKRRFGNDKHGERLITSIGGTGTGEGGNCFAAGTLVSTPCGQRPIEDLLPGDAVYGFDHGLGKVVISSVVAGRRMVSRETYRVRSLSGHSFVCTGDHPIFSPGRGYVRADRLGRGDALVVEDRLGAGTASDMRSVWQADCQAPLRGPQGSEARQPGRVLFEDVLLAASRRQECETLRGLRNAEDGAPLAVLFAGLQGQRARRAPQDTYVPGVRKILSWLDGLLQLGVRGRRALQAYARIAQPEIQNFGPLFGPVLSYAGAGTGARQEPVRGMRFAGLGNEASLWRQAFSPAGAPHQREHARQSAGEPDHVVHALSQTAPSWSLDAVASVECDGVSAVSVYDIQVAGCSNFFADGILAHNCIVIDDPNAANEAFSEATIATTIEWWDTTISTRLSNPKAGIYIIIQQRLAEDDLSGHILEKNKGEWTHLCLPMRLEKNRSFVTTIGWQDPRTEEGELLWPERFDEASVKALENALGPFGAAGQLQQRPEPAGGGIIKRQWWINWTEPQFPMVDFVLGIVDTAYTEDTMNDPSGMIVLGVFTGDSVNQATRILDATGRPVFASRVEADGSPKVMLMYAWTERLELHDLVTKVAKTAKDFKLDRLRIENKASGISVAQEIRRLYADELFAVQLADPKSQDKTSRLYSVQHLFAEGMVYAPDRPWAEAVITQVGQFPRGKHDEYVDCVSAGLRHLRDIGLLTRGEERIREIEGQKIYPGGQQIPLYPGT
jgi:predicted phage terminase large subunit-like protein